MTRGGIVSEGKPLDQRLRLDLECGVSQDGHTPKMLKSSYTPLAASRQCAALQAY